LLPGDRILKVNGFDVTRRNWDDMMMFYRVLRPVPQLSVMFVRGDEPARTVTITAKIKEQKRTLDLTEGEDIWTIIRGAEKNEPIHRTGIIEDQVGYLRIAEFNREDFDRLVGDIKNASVSIIDLRRDPGGMVVGLKDLVGHMETGEGLLQTVVRRKKTDEERFKPSKPAFLGKMVILVDSESASAAEVFTRHFQQNGRAVVVGDRTAGMVNQSRYFDQEYGDGMTVAFYGIQIAVGQVVLPNGEKLEKVGVTPDVLCLPTGDDLRNGRDPCLEKAVSIARKLAGKEETLPDNLKTQVAQLAKDLIDDTAKMEEE
jgi:C-terminal processing protease CtpA/Prc